MEFLFDSCDCRLSNYLLPFCVHGRGLREVPSLLQRPLRERCGNRRSEAQGVCVFHWLHCLPTERYYWHISVCLHKANFSLFKHRNNMTEITCTDCVFANILCQLEKVNSSEVQKKSIISLYTIYIFYSPMALLSLSLHLLYFSHGITVNTSCNTMSSAVPFKINTMSLTISPDKGSQLKFKKHLRMRSQCASLHF